MPFWVWWVFYVFVFITTNDVFGQWKIHQGHLNAILYNAPQCHHIFHLQSQKISLLSTWASRKSFNPFWSRCAETDAILRKPLFDIAVPNHSRQIWSVSTPHQERERRNYLWQTNAAYNRHVWKSNQTKHWKALGAQKTLLEHLTNYGYILQVPLCVSYLSVMTVVSISMTACQTTSSCEWRLILIGSVSVDCLCGAVQWPGALLHVCPGHHTPIFHVRHQKRARHISSDVIGGKLAPRPIYFTIKWILHQSWEFNKKFQTPRQSPMSSTQNRFQRRTVQ